MNIDFIYAIFEISNNQFLAKKNEIIISNKLNYDNNNKFLELKKILLISTKNKTLIGKPYLNNILLLVKIINTFKGKKINIIKFKRRKHHVKKMNYRSIFTKIKIIKINNY